MPLVQQQGIWMVVKGFPGAVISPRQDQANTRAILNKVQCPVLLVPETKRTTGFGHIVHTTDLRYCKLRNLNFLVELAKPYQASLLLAHICMSGLPPMEKTYAFEFFNKEICSHIRYPKLLFEQIREKKLEKVYDVLTCGMNTDLLAVVNHQFNFEDLVNHDESDNIPATLTVPLLVFRYWTLYDEHQALT